MNTNSLRAQAEKVSDYLFDNRDARTLLGLVLIGTAFFAVISPWLLVPTLFMSGFFLLGWFPFSCMFFVEDSDEPTAERVLEEA